MKTEIKCIIFDLDGTLINTITDLGNSCNYLIDKYSFDAKWNEEDYKRFVGNGMKKLVERAFKGTLSEDELDRRLAEYKEHYNKHYLDNTLPYNGIKEQLEILKSKGIKTAIVTNKAEESAIHIVESLFGKGTFDVIIGQRDNLPVKPAPDGVYIALEEMGFTKSDALYFGDSNVDMQTAKNSGIKAIGVTWGFRSREELEKEGADVIIDSPSEIEKLI